MYTPPLATRTAFFWLRPWMFLISTLARWLLRSDWDFFRVSTRDLKQVVFEACDHPWRTHPYFRTTLGFWDPHDPDLNWLLRTDVEFFRLSNPDLKKNRWKLATSPPTRSFIFKNNARIFRPLLDLIWWLKTALFVFLSGWSYSVTQDRTFHVHVWLILFSVPRHAFSRCCLVDLNWCHKTGRFMILSGWS